MSDFDKTPNEHSRFTAVDGEVKQALASLRRDNFARGGAVTMRPQVKAAVWVGATFAVGTAFGMVLNGALAERAFRTAHFKSKI